MPHVDTNNDSSPDTSTSSTSIECMSASEADGVSYAKNTLEFMLLELAICLTESHTNGESASKRDERAQVPRRLVDWIDRAVAIARVLVIEC